MPAKEKGERELNTWCPKACDGIEMHEYEKSEGAKEGKIVPSSYTHSPAMFWNPLGTGPSSLAKTHSDHNVSP